MTPLAIDSTPAFSPDEIHHALLPEVADHAPGKVQGRVLTQTARFRQILFCVPAGGALPQHFATCDATVTVLDGAGTFTRGADHPIRLEPGVHVFIPEEAPHAVTAEEDLVLLATFSGPEAAIRFT